MAPKKRNGFGKPVILSGGTIPGRTVPIKIKRPNVDITSEEGVNFRLRKEPGGTTRIIVGHDRAHEGEGAAGQDRQEQGGRHAVLDITDEEYWKNIPDRLRRRNRDWWENMVSKEQRESELGYWATVPWEQKWDNPEYVKVEAERANAERSAKIKRANREKMEVLQDNVKEAEKESGKSWGQRKRNIGAANRIFWRPFGLVMDTAALPFTIGSMAVGAVARPVSWVYDRLFKGYGYVPEKRNGVNRFKMTSGTTARDIMPSVAAEQRELYRARKMLAEEKARQAAKRKAA